MKKILIVEDTPETKIEEFLKYLIKEDIEFNYIIKKSVLSGCDYIYNNTKDIDLAIVDLGLPYRDDGPVCTATQGLLFIEECISEYVEFPIIINSSTILDSKILKELQRKINIIQVKEIWEVKEKICNFLKGKEHF